MPTNVIWIWATRKKLIYDASRYSMGNRMQMMRQQDQRPSREVIKDMTSNNSTLQELITKQRRAKALKAGNRTMKESIELPIGGVRQIGENSGYTGEAL